MAAMSGDPVFFSLTKTGVYRVIKTFSDSESGFVKDMLELPNGEWAVLNDGNGSSTTTSASIFMMTQQGVKTKVVYNFTSAEGTGPVSFLRSMDGWFYVLTSYGGATGNGRVFKIRADGSSYTKIIDNDKGTAFVVNSIFFRKAEQILSLAAISNKKVGDGMFAVVYTSSSGAKPLLTSSNTSVAIIEQGFIKIVGTGTVKITAVIPENSNFYRSNTAEQEFEVMRAGQSISFSSPGTKSFEDGSFTLNATASSGLPVIFNVVKGYVTISGNTAKILQPGSVTIQALQAGDAMWNSAETVTASFCVNPPLPTIALNESSATLSTTSLPNAWNITYQWYRNGTALPNNTSLITASESGSYTVSITIDGCKSTSTPMPVVVTGIKDEINNSVVVYPNPVKNNLNIAYSGKTLPEELQLISSMGQVYEGKATLTNDTIVLEMGDLPSGIYFLRIAHDEKVIYRKIVKE
ncbi:MAG: hypothetical protein DI538_11715 [Azospira oryzae]|nr:MAG: hypothetical protein DI538_11715 [Azospira oryzae]